MLREDRRLLGWILGSFAIVHGAMLVYDLLHPQVFLHADRASMRWDAIQGLLASESSGHTADFLAGHGILGDYVLHALVFAFAGRSGLIVFQVVLTLASGYAVFRLAQIMRLSPRQCAVAAGLYLLLPHTLVFPHQLVTEPWSTTLFIFSVWLTAEAARTRRVSQLATAALLLGLATLVRPITLLWPVLAALLWLWHEREWRFAAAYCALAFLPVLAWAAFIASQTGHWGLGESNHSMGRNLYARVITIAATMPARQRQETETTWLTRGDAGSLSAPEYLQFSLQHALPVTKQLTRDLSVFIGKSGIERLIVDYLDVHDAAARRELQDHRNGWRMRLDRDGPMAAAVYVWKTLGGVTVVISLLGVAFMLGLMTLAITGAVACHPRDARLAASLLIATPIYVFVFSQVVPAVSSRHRAPAEFALVLLAVAGYAFLRHKEQRP